MDAFTAHVELLWAGAIGRRIQDDRRTSLSRPNDVAILEVLAPVGADLEFATGWIAQLASLPALISPSLADTAVDLMRASARSPIDRRLRFAGEMHTAEVIEPAHAVRSRQFVGDRIAEIGAAELPVPLADMPPDRVGFADRRVPPNRAVPELIEAAPLRRIRLI